ncbi:RNA polymerase sigma-70 factor [Caldithrix abyssi]|nr:RNA polymerase sigma-70 factor [Caldithrix abyssi]
MANIQDHQLLEKVKGGDRDAFRKIFLQYHGPLFRFTVSRIQDADIANDIVQESFVRVWKNRQSIKPKNPFFTYLATIASNQCNDHFRHQAVRQKHENQIEDTLYTTVGNPEKYAEIAFLHEKILDAIHNYLPEKCRNIFILSRLEGMSPTEISETLNLSKRTVENQLYRGLKILREKLSDIL